MKAALRIQACWVSGLATSDMVWLPAEQEMLIGWDGDCCTETTRLRFDRSHITEKLKTPSCKVSWSGLSDFLMKASLALL